jgi:hypothetical protein
MSVLEGPGHERRLAELQRGFRHASPPLRRMDLVRWLRKIGAGAGLIILGAGLGGSAFLVLDSLQPPERQARDGVFSLRGPYYSSCREAFQDGRANILRGEPGYREDLDADGDGKACEPYAPGLR